MDQVCFYGRYLVARVSGLEDHVVEATWLPSDTSTEQKPLVNFHAMSGRPIFLKASDLSVHRGLALPNVVVCANMEETSSVSIPIFPRVWTTRSSTGVFGHVVIVVRRIRHSGHIKHSFDD